MNGKTFFLVLAILTSSMLIKAHAASVVDTNTKVVIQVTDGDPARWNMVLNNVKNAQVDLGADKITIEVVAYGPGVAMLKLDSVVAQRVTDAVKSGVKIVACENTMKGMKLSKSEMNASIGYVPSGIVEIIKRQQDGWAYVRP
jgi:intracellular sulfur oxidation DsrE/DsrF family protein